MNTTSPQPHQAPDQPANHAATPPHANAFSLRGRHDAGRVQRSHCILAD